MTERLEAYYYGFDPTNCKPVDDILVEVARAGKAFHHTGDWNDSDFDGVSPVNKIQNAASAAADHIRTQREKIEQLRDAVRHTEGFSERVLESADRGKDEVIADLRHYRRERARILMYFGELDDRLQSAANGDETVTYAGLLEKVRELRGQVEGDREAVRG